MLENHSLHITHEVVNDPRKAESIARAKASQSRYKYLANALLLGYPKLEPYDPIYLKGLPDGMDGIWVVISVVHTINKGLPYTMSVHIGSNDQLLSLKPDAFGDILDTRHHIRAVINSRPDDGFVGKPVKKTGKHVLKSNEFTITPLSKEQSTHFSNSQSAKYKAENSISTGEDAIVPDPTTYIPNIAGKKAHIQWVRE
jgi:hypothetical protein